jgi:DNA-binding IclR family transcriptional regulator
MNDNADMVITTRADETDSAKEPGGVQSLRRAFSILECIASTPEGLSLAELSKRVGLHNSTTFHLTKTMVSLGYVRQTPENKKYHLGRMVFSLASSSRMEIDLVALATPILEELSRSTGESCHLAVLTGQDILVVAKTSGTGAFQLQERHGGTRPGHATALGKVLLAFQPQSMVESYLKVHGMPALTPKTLVDHDALMRELEVVRRTGIAYDDGEFHSEVRCMAVPVYDFTGKVICTIGVSGPIWHISLQKLEELAGALNAGAARLSAELGGHQEIR